MGRPEMLGEIVQSDESINGGDESVNVILVECGEERKEIVGATEKRIIIMQLITTYIIYHVVWSF